MTVKSLESLPVLSDLMQNQKNRWAATAKDKVDYLLIRLFYCNFQKTLFSKECQVGI